jgi:hypothetical protein
MRFGMVVLAKHCHVSQLGLPLALGHWVQVVDIEQVLLDHLTGLPPALASVVLQCRLPQAGVTFSLRQNHFRSVALMELSASHPGSKEAAGDELSDLGCTSVQDHDGAICIR